jgi:hypothetical protein
MDSVGHVEAALARLTREDISALSPVRRAQLADRLRHWWQITLEKQHGLNPRAGVLTDLQNGRND